MKRSSLLIAFGFVLGAFAQWWAAHKIAAIKQRNAVPQTSAPITQPEPQVGGTMGVPLTMEFPKPGVEAAQFDVSLSLEGPKGEFYGEIGLGGVEVIPDSNNRAVGFDLWLFDKSDVRTETKIPVSPALKKSDTLYKKLSLKGELMPVGPDGMDVTFRSESLECHAHITAEFEEGDPRVFKKLCVVATTKLVKK